MTGPGLICTRNKIQILQLHSCMAFLFNSYRYPDLLLQMTNSRPCVKHSRSYVTHKRHQSCRHSQCVTAHWHLLHLIVWYRGPLWLLSWLMALTIIDAMTHNDPLHPIPFHICASRDNSKFLKRMTENQKIQPTS